MRKDVILVSEITLWQTSITSRLRSIMIGWQEQQQKTTIVTAEKKKYDDGSKDASDDGGNGSVKNVNHEKYG